MERKPIVAIDLFCGAGGLSYGLKKSGVSVLAGIDIDPACKWPYEENIGAQFLQRSIRDVTGSDLLEIWEKAPGYRLLAGCAPCQPFSSQRRGADSSKDDNWDLLREFGRLVRETKPDFVTMENVALLQRSPMFSEFLGNLAAEGYFVDHEVLFGPNYGLAQARKRLVLLASRHGQVVLPKGKYGPGTYKTVRDVIGTLPRLQSGQTDEMDRLHKARNLTAINIRRIQNSKAGGTWRDWPVELRAKCHQRESGSSFGAFYGRMSWDEPSPTITTQAHNYGSGRFGHPEQDRSITLREAAMLQGFPQDYQFIPTDEKVTFTHVGRMIGNAVPPVFGEIIGNALEQELLQQGSS